MSQAADAFASLFSSQQSSSGTAAGYSPFNIPASFVSLVKTPDPLTGITANVSPTGQAKTSWTDAIANAAKAAVKAVTPGSTGAASAGINGMSQAVGDGVSAAGKGIGNTLTSAAAALDSAQAGVKQGASSFVFWVLVAAGLYVAWLVLPFFRRAA